MKMKRMISFYLTGMVITGLQGFGQRIPYATGDWDPELYGNHRAVVEVEAGGDAVWVHIPWRRRDSEPEKKNLIVVDAATGARITNLARLAINREFGDIVFQPQTVPGRYYIYYLPYKTSGRSNYPTVTYPEPEETADSEWLLRHKLSEGRSDWKMQPQPKVVEFQSIDELNSFYPMEIIATRAETEALLARYPHASYLIFPEDRAFPIRMCDDLPLKWIESVPAETFRGKADRGEFYAFQIGVYAMRRPIDKLEVELPDFERVEGGFTIPASRSRCINLGGLDWTGEALTKTVSVEEGKVQAIWCGVEVPEDAHPGVYLGAVSVRPEGMKATSFDFELEVGPDVIAASGDDEPWRHSRLRWLDSTIALDDETVSPYTPVEVTGNTVKVLGREIILADTGFPRSITSTFSSEMTHIVDDATEILAGPLQLVVEDVSGQILPWRTSGLRKSKEAPGIVVWESESAMGSLTMNVRTEVEFDGNMELTVVLRATERLDVGDIRLLIPYQRGVAKYMMGMGRKGGYRPDTFQWNWDVTRNQDGAWIGDVHAGLQFTMKDQNYSRPLNTNFYQSKPLVMPTSWSNSGRGGCHLGEQDDGEAFLVDCYSGERTLRAGEELYYNFRLLVTPFRPIDTKAQWSTRFYHRFEPIDTIAATGANTINVHHATEINPWINYPFLRPEAMKAYVDEAHDKGMKVKIYYTVRELSNRAPEIFALRSLGDEIFSRGPGGGFSWLQEHLGGDYIAGWLVPRIKDAAVVNSGVSRWHNYYLEGLNWVVKNVGIDGLYIDDVAFDRTVMKRLRKILDRGREGALIDLHSANQFNERDGFAVSANLYLEHFPYLNRLWFGEYFDCDSPPDFWMVELSGIPFGIMGEMLQDGGNPWRGMLYGMTSRLPWAGDPSPLWRFWDEVGIQDMRMFGYWAASAPVETSHEDVLATTYLGDERAVVSLASWAEGPVDVELHIDWDRMGMDPQTARVTAPAIENFQEERTFDPKGAIPVEPGRGWLLVIELR